MKVNCKNIVFSNSATVYKKSRSNRPLVEDDICEPINHTVILS